jgi:hypothetical protein
VNVNVVVKVAVIADIYTPSTNCDTACRYYKACTVNSDASDYRKASCVDSNTTTVHGQAADNCYTSSLHEKYQKQKNVNINVRRFRICNESFEDVCLLPHHDFGPRLHRHAKNLCRFIISIQKG